MSYVDFRVLKEQTTLEAVVAWLGLTPRNNRMQCPVNMGDKRELVINTQKQLFYCFGCKAGGDLIQLAAHITKMTQKQAALAIQREFTKYEPAKRGLTSEAIAKIGDEMQYEHEEVQALGFMPERARELGIGWRKGGTKPKMVLIPWRNERGEVVDYIGYSQEKGLVFSKAMLK